MKLKKIKLSHTMTVTGFRNGTGFRELRDVEANLNQHGVALPYGTNDELLIPWGHVEYLLRERQAQQAK